MGDHLVEGGVAVLGTLDADDLDLVELMEAVQPPDVLAVGTGFAAEARRIGRKLLREVRVLEDDVTVDVGDGHLRGGDEIEVIQADVVHLRLLVGKLARPEAGSGVDHHGRLHLAVARGRVEVEEVVDQRALQLGSLSLVHRESGAGELDAQVEVDDVELAGEFPVRKGSFGKHGIRAAHLDHLVVFGALAGNDEVARHIGQKHQLVLEFLVVLFRFREQRAAALFQRGDRLLGLLGLLAASFLHQAADLGRLLLLLAEQRVALLLEGLAMIVEGDDLFNNSSRIKILDGELCDDFLRVFPERFECKHY